MERFVCPRCSRFYAIESKRWRCECGSYLDLEFYPQFSIKKILQREHTLWRYREALPIQEKDSIVSIKEGFTPLIEMEIEGKWFFLKIDFLFPTGSYKDRGATVLVSKVKELGIHRVVEDSSGNAGSAISAYCAKGGIRCEIYVPYSTSPEKLVQIQSYGAILNKVKGSREETARKAMEAANQIFYASHCWNPFFLHGTKTFAFEVWEQLGWKCPDTLILPVGHGTLFLGAYIGFKELREEGMINKIPRLIGIQASACAPLYQAFQKGAEEPLPVEKKETMAEGIAIAEPVRGRQILESLRETGGEIFTVTDNEIKRTLFEMGKKGYFIEPTSAGTIAGLKKYMKKAGKKEKVLSTLTGIGLKASEKILHMIR